MKNKQINFYVPVNIRKKYKEKKTGFDLLIMVYYLSILPIYTRTYYESAFAL